MGEHCGIKVILGLLAGTPNSQGSFGDGARDGENSRSGNEAAKTEEDDERAKLPPYLPSVYGCRSVEEFHVRSKHRRRFERHFHDACLCL